MNQQPGPHQPAERLIDFGRDRQMRCDRCAHEWKATLDWIELFETSTATCPSCGANGMKSDCPRPTVMPDDPALIADNVPHLFWYHSTTHSQWPPHLSDPAASLDEQTKLMMGGARQVTEWARRQQSKALHIGTYEAAVHNMLRRLAEQADPGKQVYLYRVHLRPDVVVRGNWLVEPVDVMGDVSLADVCPPGIDVTRYLNLHEDPGGISLALGRGAIASTQRIEVPRLPSANDDRVAGIVADIDNAIDLPHVSARLKKFASRPTPNPQSHRAHQIARELGQQVPPSVRENLESAVTFSFDAADVLGWARYTCGLLDLILDHALVLARIDESPREAEHIVEH